MQYAWVREEEYEEKEREFADVREKRKRVR